MTLENDGFLRTLMGVWDILDLLGELVSKGPGTWWPRGHVCHYLLSNFLSKRFKTVFSQFQKFVNFLINLFNIDKVSSSRIIQK